MEVQVGINVIDEPNLLFKIQRKIKVFDTNDPLPNRGYNLVASASKYGAVFMGTPDGKLAVYRVNELIDKECEPCPLPVQLQEKPTHIAVNCDQELLAVTGGRLFVVFKVVDLLNQNVSPSLSVQFDVNPSTFVTDVKWNPCVPDTIAYAFYDGAIVICQAGQGMVKKLQSSARCICWSPKGKQLVVGNSDGTICQYKPDLSLMKSFPAPNIFNGAPVEVLVIHWISTFQFAVVYKNASDNSKPAVTIVNTPKGGQPSCLNCEDICYSMGSNRPWYYYLQGLPQWNMILCSSSNSMEIATLGSADGANWAQWCQSDEARPELPLTDKKQENYPIGISIDTAAIHQLPWGENETLPYMPTLHVLSQTGLLTLFNVINLNKQAPQICTPVTNVGTPFPAQSQPVSAPAVAAPPKPVQSLPPHAPAPVAVSAATGFGAPAGSTQAFGAPAGSTQAFGAPAGSTQTFGAPAGSTQAFGAPAGSTQAFGAPAGSTQALGAPAGSAQVFGTAAFKQQLQPQQQQQPQPQAQVVQPPRPQENQPPVAVSAQIPKPAPQKDQTQINAALMAEQKAANRQKANLEFKNMLVKEVNEFQAELYEFVVKTRKAQIQFYRELHAIDTNPELQNLDIETLKRDCSLDELRSAIIALKLDLVRACAVVAEARTQSDAKDLDQWTQADPLTTKRVASVKKLAYYVQTQLDQAHRALDYKWNLMAERDMKSNKSGPRMIRPIMDDVYQPLVKQQEILSRQEAVLKVLRNTLKECDGSPVYKSTPLLRSTPFKNKDPLSKLTKNILNMSIEPQKPENKNLLTPQKLDALRDMLSNHKTVKIKPVNVEMRHHMAEMRVRYEKSVKEKANEQVLQTVQSQPTGIRATVDVPAREVKPEIKTEVKFPPKPMFTPIVVTPGQPPSATTRFTEEPKQEPISPLTQPQKTITITSTPTVPVNRNALKDLLQNKEVTVEVKKDNNIMENFMGQNICSPTNFNFSSVIVATPTSFTTKPISALNNMFTQFQQPDNNSSETGEPESSVKEEKLMSNLFKMTTSTPKPNVPDVLGNSNMITIKRVEPKEPKPLVAQQEKSKENIAAKTENVILSIPKVNKDDKKENEPKPFSIQNTNKPLFSSIAQPGASSAFAVKADDVQKTVENKSKLETEAPKVTQKSAAAASSASSIFATANATITVPKPKSIFGPVAVTSTTPTECFQSISGSKPSATGTSIFAAVSTSATSKTEPSSAFGSSIFASANSALAPKTQSSSIFSTTSTPSSVFGGSASSIFGTNTSVQSSVATTTTASAAKSADSPGSVSTSSSVFGSTAKSVFSSVALTTTTTTTAAQPPTATAPASTPSAFESTASKPSSVFSATSLPLLTTTPTVSTQAATTAQNILTSTTTTAQSSTTSSIFGSPSSTTQPSVFGGTPTSTTSIFGSAAPTPASVFGSTATAKPAFGVSTTTEAAVTATTPTSTPASPTTTQPPSSGNGTTQASIFGGTTTQSSIFGTTAMTSTSAFGSTTTTPAPAFGNTTTSPSSVFGSATKPQASVFEGTATTPTSVFGTAATTSAFATPTTASSFGSTAATQASVFGTTTTQSSVFGGNGANQTSVFGTPATTQASVFGSTTTTQSVFGSPATSQPSVFGTPASQASVFGSTATTQSVFGSPQTTQASVFGSPQTTQSSVFGSATSPASVFGQANQSVFGSPASPASVFGSAQTQASVFGTPTQSTQASVFGTPTQTTQASAFGTTATTQASVFGSPTQSVFGTPATTAQSSLFGGGDSLFASVNISTTSASQSGGSIFGGGSTASPGFGSNTNVFGGKTTFGQSNPTAEAIFGGGGGGFGQTAPANNFWGSNNNSSGGFGSTGFGQQATTQPSTVFGTGSFSASSPPGQAFGSPTSSPGGGFGSGFGSKAVFGQPSGFGSPTSSGFGAPAAFGGFSKSPGGFGAAPSFGGGAAFGGSAFGTTSPGGVFGGNAPSAGFGSPTQSNATFESLATQNTLTFGNLAQQSAQPAPSFNTSPSFTGWRG